jgi:microcystin-dependent protein
VGGTPGQTGIDTLEMTWLIAAQQASIYDAPLAGMLALFGGSSVPGGWLAADGSTYQISAWPDLFNAIGNTFGGDGQTTFAVPNLTGAAPVGTGISPAGSLITMGETVAGQTPGLGLDYLICTNGILPPEGGNGTLPTEFFLGQIVAWAGNTIPQGWQACDGSLLSIQRQNGLYQVIGTLYGGDGTSNYAVPNLSGLMIQGRTIGEAVRAGPVSSAPAGQRAAQAPVRAMPGRSSGRRIQPAGAPRRR